MPVTKQSLNTWLYGCGWHCPRCSCAVGHVDKISKPDVQDDTVYIDFRCPKCALEWANGYRLSNPVILNDDADEDLIQAWFDKNGSPGMRWEGEDA